MVGVRVGVRLGSGVLVGSGVADGRGVRVGVGVKVGRRLSLRLVGSFSVAPNLAIGPLDLTRSITD